MQDEFDSLNHKRMKQILELEETTKQLVELSEKVYEKSPDYVRIICPGCNGSTIKDSEDGKKVKCGCYPKGYLWMKRFKEEEKTNGN